MKLMGYLWPHGWGRCLHSGRCLTCSHQECFKSFCVVWKMKNKTEAFSPSNFVCIRVWQVCGRQRTTFQKSVLASTLTEASVAAPRVQTLWPTNSPPPVLYCQSPVSTFCSPVGVQGLQMHTHILLFMWVLRIRLRSLGLCGKRLYTLSYLPSPCFVFWKRVSN